MKLIPIKCPNCNASLKIEAGRKMCFCEYCGQQIFLDDGVQRSEHTENINIRDDAMMRRADARIKELELIKRREDRKIEKEKRQMRGVHKFFIIGIILNIVLWTPLIIINSTHQKKAVAIIKDVQKEYDIGINSVKYESNEYDYEIVVYTDDEDTITKIENAIIDRAAGKRLKIKIVYDHKIIRTTTVNGYGTVDRIDGDTDETEEATQAS